MNLEKLTIASLTSIATPLVSAASAFMVSPVLIRSLGQNDYGVWMFALSIAGYCALIDLGMSGTAMRFLSTVSHETSDSKRFASLIRVFQRFYLWASFAIISIAFIVLIVAFLVPGETETKTICILVSGLTATIGTNFLLRLYPAILRAFLDYHLISLANIARNVLFTSYILLYKESVDIYSLLGLHAGLTLGEGILIYVFARKRLPDRNLVRTAPIPELRSIASHAGKNVLGGVADNLRWRVDTQLIGGMISIPMVTQYSLGMRLPNLFFDLLYTLFGSQFAAAFAQMRAGSSKGDLLGALKSATLVCTAISFSGAFTLFFLIPPFMERWLGQGFEQAAVMAQIIIPSWALLASQAPLTQYLVAEAKHGRLVLMSVAGAVANLLLSLVLIYFIGYKGVVVATAIEFLALSLVRIWVICPLIKVSPAKYLFDLTIFPLLKFTPPVGIAAYLIVGKIESNYLNLLVTSSILFLFCTIVSFFTIVDPRTRKSTIRRMKEFLLL